MISDPKFRIPLIVGLFEQFGALGKGRNRGQIGATD
jgi:hypothetical protein